MKNSSGKTLSQMLSIANKRVNWINKLKNNVEPSLNRLNGLFSLTTTANFSLH